MCAGPGAGKFALALVRPRVTLSASYRLSGHWLGRLSWNRVMTGYDRDADLLLAGVGYRF
ncbi:hypothetical protein ACTMU2_08535 [Cupriavidus basilensis]